MDGNVVSINKAVLKLTTQIKDWLYTNPRLTDHAQSMGVTHLRLRRCGTSLVIHGFRIGIDTPIVHPLSTDHEDGYWFALTDRLTYHTTAPQAKVIPGAVLTAIAHPECFIKEAQAAW